MRVPRFAWALGAVILCASALPVAAQQTGTITGQVVDQTTSRPLESAQVVIEALDIGGLTSREGRFLLNNVPAGTHELKVVIIGYTRQTQTVSVSAGQATVADFRMAATALSLQEIVVTGVAGETPKVKLPFTVEKVDFERQPVRAPSADGLLQGKVAGAKVVRGSGKPGDDASIMLRGPTSISNSQNPLIIVDGVITDNALADIDALDVSSIEVVKGAAAASLYGSRAANGVIQITTKRGQGLDVDQTRITVRNEFGNQSLESRIGLAQSHPYAMDASKQNFLDGDGNPIPYGPGVQLAGGNPDLTFQDNPFPGQNYDAIGQFFDPGNTWSNYVAIEGKTGTTNYRASFTNFEEQGIIKGHEGFQRRNFRLNLDHQASDKLNISLSTYFAQSNQDEIGTNPFFSLTFMPPNANLEELAEDGTLNIAVDPLSLEENPLYEIANRDWVDKRQRFMGSAFIRYEPITGFELEGNFSIDRNDFHRSDLTPKGYKQLESDPLKGDIRKENSLSNDVNASLTASFNRAFGDLTTRTKFRYLLEDTHYEFFSAFGDELSVADVPTLAVASGSKNVDSEIRDVVAEGFFFISALDYKGKYIGDVLVRRDGSSLFGPDERWQTYYRGSAAWRVSQEDWFNSDFLNELKFRYSYGTAGNRPRFNAQYETYSVSNGTVRPINLGNKILKPEFAKESEYGIDMVFVDRYSLQLTYSDSEIDDLLLQVPLPAYNGFTTQWQNAGALSSNTFEASLEASLIESQDLSFSARVNFDRTRQEITRVDLPPYRTGSRSAFFIREGEALGTFYGTKWATNCADLGGSANCGDFQLNDDGYLVYVGAGNSYTDGVAKSLWGTSTDGYDWGMPVAATAEDGSEFARMGSTTPDFTLSWSGNLRYKNLGLYALFDWEQGSEIYNGTAQWAYREWRHEQVDQQGKAEGAKKPVSYYSALYNVNSTSSHFVEDGSFVKLRELSVRYGMNADQLGGFGARLGLESAAINLIGRNLITWTDYTGYDPEVGTAGTGSGGAAAIGRIDSYQYPNFRSMTASIELVF